MSQVIVKSVKVRDVDGTVRHRVKLKMLRSETKPTDVADGSVILEKDTGKRFEFDRGTLPWYEQPAGGGGSGDEFDDWSTTGL